MSDITQNIRRAALNAGASLVGFAPAEFDERGLKDLKAYIERGAQGSMKYMEDYKKRVDPQAIFPGAKSVIVIAVNYWQKLPKSPKGHKKIALYAYGRDYHKVIKGILKKIVKQIEELDPKIKTKICVDTAPLLEKSYAVRAGIGFIGKNTTLITKEFGSYVLLGEILIDKKLTYSKVASGTCGRCTRCIDACPTQAITKPYTMDAKRCISYLTIESREEIPKELKSKIGNRLFGCDTCQEVCPYNKQFAKQTKVTDFLKPIAGRSIDPELIIRMKTEEDFVAHFAGSPLMRAKLKGLKRTLNSD